MYDLNNDDDDEIRALAAPVVTKILAADGRKVNDVVPLAASFRLAEDIAYRFGTNNHAAVNAVNRITSNAVSTSNTTPVKQLLTDKSKQDLSLFIQEKQNLFIDETREAKVWSNIAAKLQPEAFSADLVRELARWTIDGLNVLVAEVEAHPDTPLGWSRKSEVFVLGVQVIHAAGLLLKLLGKLERCPISAGEVRTSLQIFSKKGEENGANILWLDTIRDVLDG